MSTFDDDDAIVYVKGGGMDVVDVPHLQRLAGHLGEAIELAEGALLNARGALGFASQWPAQGVPGGGIAVGELDRIVNGRLGLGRYVDLLRELLEDLLLAIQQYLAGEMTLEHAIGNQRAALPTMPWLPWWSIPVVRPYWTGYLDEVRKAIFMPGQPTTTGAYAQMLLNIGPLALFLGDVLRHGPLGVLLPEHLPRDTAGVPYLTATILQLTRFDRFTGNYDVYFRSQHGANMLVARLKGPGGPNPLRLAEEAGSEVAEEIVSAGEVLEHMETLSENSREVGAGVFSAVRTEAEDGDTAWLIVIPGTQEKFASRNPQDHLSNVQMMAGMDSDLYESVRAAILSLPVEAADQVSFMGHSQGGILAAELARDPAVQAHLGGAVDFLITAGSPVGQVNVPEETRMVNFVNADDWIPGLGGTSPHTSEHHLTVVVDHRAEIPESIHPHDHAAYAAAIEAGREEVEMVDAVMADFEAAMWSEGAEQTEFVFEFTREDMGERWAAVALPCGGPVARP
nr:hypothetical protein [Actinomycetales bacterium]